MVAKVTSRAFSLTTLANLDPCQKKGHSCQWQTESRCGRLLRRGTVSSPLVSTQVGRGGLARVEFGEVQVRLHGLEFFWTMMLQSFQYREVHPKSGQDRRGRVALAILHLSAAQPHQEVPKRDRFRRRRTLQLPHQRAR